MAFAMSMGGMIFRNGFYSRSRTRESVFDGIQLRRGSCARSGRRLNVSVTQGCPIDQGKLLIKSTDGRFQLFKCIFGAGRLAAFAHFLKIQGDG